MGVLNTRLQLHLQRSQVHRLQLLGQDFLSDWVRGVELRVVLHLGDDGGFVGQVVVLDVLGHVVHFVFAGQHSLLQKVDGFADQFHLVNDFVQGFFYFRLQHFVGCARGGCVSELGMGWGFLNICLIGVVFIVYVFCGLEGWSWRKHLLISAFLHRLNSRFWTLCLLVFFSETWKFVQACFFSNHDLSLDICRDVHKIFFYFAVCY